MSTTTLPPIVLDGVEHADPGYCRTTYGPGSYRDIHGGGAVLHTAYCRRSQQRDTAISGSDCIRPDQDGARIAAEREAAADRRRFTPPEYRERPVEPASIIIVDRRQPVRVLALRGRPKVPGAKWTTWETYEDQGDGTFWGDMQRMVNAPQPAAMTTDEAQSIVEEFSARVPTHEFKVVLARLTITEEHIA